MLSKCAECYKDNKKPSNKDCLKCENDYKRLEQKYNEVLKLAKENADSNEYCLQEDEEIVRNLKEEHNHYIDVINELKKENKELKKKYKEKKYLIENILPEASKYAMKCGEFRQALKEIREIAKTVISASNCSNCDGVGYYDGCLDDKCGDYAIRKIAEKINEVLK